MKKTFFRLRRATAFAQTGSAGSSASAADAAPRSAFFSTTLATRGLMRVNTPLVPWQARAIEIGATPWSAAQGCEQLASLWIRDAHMKALGEPALRRLGRHFEYARIEPGRDVIRQSEFSRFMVVVLSGEIVVERDQDNGQRLTLAQTRSGDMLGEISLLDGGPRFSSCRSLTPCQLAVLTAEALDGLLTQEPVLAAQAVALLARRVSLQLRTLSARFIDEPHT